MFLRKLYYILGPKTRRLARRAYYLPADTLDLLTGKRDNMTPPKGRIFIGSGDFKKQGLLLMNQLIEHGGLQPNHSVLDVGSGIGRLAIPLTQYLSEDGAYQGFDIVKTGVDWCTKNVSTLYPNFKFKHIDLVNDLYNLETKDEAKNFVFPYNEKSFDLVFLFSVFSHMVEPDVANYLKEIARVLKPGGKCVATFFVLNEESRKLMNAGTGLQFKYEMENYYVIDQKVHTANVGFDQTRLEGLIKDAGLQLEALNPGYWSGRNKAECVDFQDVVVLAKH